MKLEQVEPTSVSPTPSPDEAPFPSARYFQVHFEYLNQQIDSLRSEVDSLKRQLLVESAQNSIASRPQRHPGSAGKIRFQRR